MRICFSDNGAGISPENLNKVFDPFFTTKFGRGGNGLGSSVCYNIVKTILDGNISVNSELQQGTAFILELPLKVASGGPSQTTKTNAG